MVRALELFEAEIAEAHTEDGEPVRGEAGHKLMEMAEAIDKDANIVFANASMDHVLSFLGYIAARLDDLERRLSPEDDKLGLTQYLYRNHTRTAFRPDDPEGVLIYKIAARLDRMEGRAPPGSEQDKPGMRCMMPGCRGGWVPDGEDLCTECGGGTARL